MAAKSKKQRRIEAKNKKEAQKFWRVVLISTVILLILLFIMYRNFNG